MSQVFRRRPSRARDPVAAPMSDGDDDGPAAVVPSSEPSALDRLMDKLPLSERWKKWTVRSITCWSMIYIFYLIVSFGPEAVACCVCLLQLVAFNEVVSIGYLWKNEKHLPLFRVQQWYFLGVAFYGVYGATAADYVARVVRVPGWLLNHHSFITFSLYCIGFVMFVVSLRESYYKYQLAQFGWTHMSILLVILPNIFVIQNLFAGMFWFLLPSTLIFANDIMAYIFGFHFGKTPLIQLSPKKTWEGFVGGGLSTLVWGWWFAGLLASNGIGLCPNGASTCTLNPVFELTPYELPHKALVSVCAALGYRVTTSAVYVYPVQLDALALAVFASVVAPFGGFFASGVKRAYNLKDFGSMLPGHGGLTDRVDCQFLAAACTYFYYKSFVQQLDIEFIANIITKLSAEDRSRVCSRVGALCSGH